MQDGIGGVRGPSGVTPEWLTQVLRRAKLLDGHAVVASFTSKTVGTGQMGMSVRYRLQYERLERPAPESLVCKFASEDATSRATGLALRAYEAEVSFYRDVAHTVMIRTPKCYFADIDLTTGEFVLVLEDLAPAEQGDQMAGCTPDQAALAMEELAKLHAPRWDDPHLDALDWLNRSSPEQGSVTSQLVASVFPGFLDRYTSRLTPDNVRVAEHFMSKLQKWMENRSRPFVVQHADYRLDNMLFGTNQGGYPLAVVDWQTVVLGPPLSDASYFLGAGLLTEDRRKDERALLHVYYDALHAFGVRGYSWDRCWRDYRHYSYAGLLMAIAASMLVVQTERGDEMFMAMANRHAAQILDLEAEELL